MENFQSLSLNEGLIRSLTRLNFDKPTPIQQASIPLALEGKDIIACAETGSGKTGAYGIPLVENVINNPGVIGLVLTPTREIAMQVADFLRLLVGGFPQLKVATLVGGADIRKQLNGLRQKPRIIVATPGRLTDHIRRKSVNLKKAEILVLDEGDRMLDMGFAPQLDEILKYLPEQRQTSLFTATLPLKVKELASNYLQNPEKIQIGRGSLPVKAIKQSVIKMGFKEKDDKIIDELNQREGSVIVFARTKHRTDILARNLKEYGFKVDIIHGGRTQGQRNQAIQSFKSGKSRILCATDVAARGIDVPQVEHVINFDLPMMSEDYVHRIGRTARNGAKGEAVSFVTPEEVRYWMSIAKKYEIPGVELELPSSSNKRGGGPGRGARGRGGKRAAGGSRVSFKERRSDGSGEGRRPSRGASEGSSNESSFKKKFSGKKKSGGKFGGPKSSGGRPPMGAKKKSGGKSPRRSSAPAR